MNKIEILQAVGNEFIADPPKGFETWSEWIKQSIEQIEMKKEAPWPAQSVEAKSTPKSAAVTRTGITHGPSTIAATDAES